MTSAPADFPGFTRSRGRPRIHPPKPVGPPRPRGQLPGEKRRTLAALIASGLSGCADSLAERTGWPPEAVRRTLWEMSRAGEVQNQAPRALGHKGQQPGQFAAPALCERVDAVAFARQVWR
jgi:hypothetical protein